MIPLIVLIIDLYRYSPHSSKYLKNVFTSVFTLSLRKILFLSVNLALGQVIPLKPFKSIKKYIDNDNYVSNVFTDLEKAFHTVDHQILLQKLYHCGIWGLAHSWFRSYFSNRQQFIFISGSFSLMSIKCGVPQGSTLGPLLCLLYINDLNFVFNKATMIHFADDTHVSYVSKKLSTIESIMSYELKKLAD